MDKKSIRIRRARRARYRMKRCGVTRLVVFRTPRHMYAQVISPNFSILAAASTLEKTIAEKFKNTGNKEAAMMVGKFIAKRAIEKGVKCVSFDRAGFSYHGRVKALAESAREVGLQF